MSEIKFEFGEPWVSCCELVATFREKDICCAQNADEAERIVACVNACAGMPTKDLEETGFGGLRVEIESLKADKSDEMRKANDARSIAKSRLAEIEKRDRLIKRMEGYQRLMERECDEITPIAEQLGWRSSRFEDGVAARATIADLKAAITAFEQEAGPK